MPLLQDKRVSGTAGDQEDLKPKGRSQPPAQVSRDTPSLLSACFSPRALTIFGLPVPLVTASSVVWALGEGGDSTPCTQLPSSLTQLPFNGNTIC